MTGLVIDYFGDGLIDFVRTGPDLVKGECFRPGCYQCEANKLFCRAPEEFLGHIHWMSGEVAGRIVVSQSVEHLKVT